MEAEKVGKEHYHKQLDAIFAPSITSEYTL